MREELALTGPIVQLSISDEVESLLYYFGGVALLLRGRLALRWTFFVELVDFFLVHDG